ncbi:hypothetical protein KSP39_PZI005277 [Platanthera zijinensis]|uniref:Transposase n=1 Tax=Platanthera zijinensis TaxID=2320716 RepID=A0AAP0GBH9_9ASPA
MTTNASESFNGVLKRSRGLPIQALVSATYYHCIAMFLKREEDSKNWANEAASRFVPKVLRMLRIRKEKGKKLNKKCSNK